MKKKTGRADRVAKTPQKRARSASRRCRAPRHEKACVGPGRRSRPMTRNRPFAGSGPNWRRRRRESTNWRPRADTDFLLDIPNRRGFERELNRSIAYIKRYHASGALIVLDVDRLKPINDAFGHAAGDQVLKAIVAVLRARRALLGRDRRLGGDEFALLLWNLSETDAHAKAASLEQSHRPAHLYFGGRTVTAGASAGVAVLGLHAEAGRALEEADSAMYVRKAQRRHEV